MGKTAPIRPSGTRNLGALIEHCVSVRAKCDRCGKCKDVDLAALAERVGAAFDLWDRRPRCNMTPGCEGRVLFMHDWHGGFMFPMKD